jgi:hypothetical protein
MQKLGFKCVKYHSSDLEIQDSLINSNKSKAQLPILNGVYEYLGSPGPDVIREMTGVASEKWLNKRKRHGLC